MSYKKRAGFKPTLLMEIGGFEPPSSVEHKKVITCLFCYNKIQNRRHNKKNQKFLSCIIFSFYNSQEKL